MLRSILGLLLTALFVGGCDTWSTPDPVPYPPRALYAPDPDRGFERTPTIGVPIRGPFGMYQSLVAAPAPGTACPSGVTAPLRPSPQDVSIKYPRSVKYKWFRGCTATQTQRDAMQESLFAVYIPQVYAYGLSMPACKSANKGAIAELTGIGKKLATAYEQKSFMPSGKWVIGEDGRHYQKEDYILTDYRKCSLGADVDCAKNPRMTPDLQDLLNIRIENGKCVANATRFQAWCDKKDQEGEPCRLPLEPFDPTKRDAGTIDNDPKHPIQLSPATLSLGQHASDLHAQGSAAGCNQGQPPAPGAVQAAHMAFEDAAGREKGEIGHHFARMKDFGGCATDPRWTPSEVCKVKTLEHELHHAWLLAVQRGDWGHARQADADHQLAHLCACIKEPYLEMRFSCGTDRSEDCPVVTCNQRLGLTP